MITYLELKSILSFANQLSAQMDI